MQATSLNKKVELLGRGAAVGHATVGVANRWAGHCARALHRAGKRLSHSDQTGEQNEWSCRIRRRVTVACLPLCCVVYAVACEGHEPGA
jgi:hypothetical protein